MGMPTCPSVNITERACRGSSRDILYHTDLLVNSTTPIPLERRYLLRRSLEVRGKGMCPYVILCDAGHVYYVCLPPARLAHEMK
jgi:hypothetical protein